MDIKQLRFLDALAQEKHFGRAAAACFISQPTLSLRIRQLEDELGVPLIYRGNRFQGLTPEGEKVLAWARRVLMNYEGLYQDVALIKGKLDGNLRLGIVPSALPFAAQLTTPFLAKYRKVSVISTSHTADEITQMLEGFMLDMGIAYLSSTLPENICSMELYQESYVVLVPADEYFPGRTEISWREAATLPLCLLTKGMHNRWIIEDAFAQSGCVVEPQLQSNSIMTLYTHVRAGYWATIAPSFHAKLVGIPEGVRALKLTQPHVEHPVGLLWRDTDPLSPLIEAFRLVAEERLTQAH